MSTPQNIVDLYKILNIVNLYTTIVREPEPGAETFYREPKPETIKIIIGSQSR